MYVLIQLKFSALSLVKAPRVDTYYSLHIHCPRPPRKCAKLAPLLKLYNTILYSAGVKVVVNTTVGQLGAV